MNKRHFLPASLIIYFILLVVAANLTIENFDPEDYPGIFRWLVAFACTLIPCLFISGAFYLWQSKLRGWAGLFVVVALAAVIGLALNNVQTLDKDITKAQGAISIAQSHKKALEAERNSLQSISDTNEQKVSCTLITLPDGSTRQACNDPNKDLRTQKKNAREKIAQINDQLPAFDEEIAKQQKFIEDNDGKNARMAFLVQSLEVFLSAFIGLIAAYGRDHKDQDGPLPPDPKDSKYNVLNLNKLLHEISSKTRKQWLKLYPRHNIIGVDELLHTIGNITRKQWRRLYPRHNVQNVDELLNEGSFKTRQQWTKPKPNEGEQVLEDLKRKKTIQELAEEKLWKP